MCSDKLVFLIVTGTWHPPACYEFLNRDLERLGYECAIPHMPSMGHGANGVTWEADRDKVIETATPYFKQGKEVVIVGHSYGGIPAASATEGQSVEERAKQGKKGGFRSVIFMAAFAVPQKGTDLLSTFGGAWPDWQNTQEAYTKNKLSTLNDLGRRLLYNDTTDEEGHRAFALCLPHSQDAFETPCEFVASDITIPKTYLICENDLVFPLMLQQLLIKSVPGMKEARIQAGHSPFLGKSEETARILLDIAAGNIQVM